MTASETALLHESATFAASLAARRPCGAFFGIARDLTGNVPRLPTVASWRQLSARPDGQTRAYYDALALAAAAKPCRGAGHQSAKTLIIHWRGWLNADSHCLGP
jgi:hypothetical protein